MAALMGSLRTAARAARPLVMRRRVVATGVQCRHFSAAAAVPGADEFPEPDETWLMQKEVFGGATQFGVSKYLKKKPKGPTLLEYHPKMEVRQLQFYTNDRIETRLERLKVRRARGKGTPKKGSGKRAKLRK